MNKLHYLPALLLLSFAAHGQEAEDSGDEESSPATEETVEAVAAPTPDQPRTMSGMSILGNEEAPKALVIIPWKTSELGDELGMPEQLDDRATPVDRDVFLRELRFFEIRQDDK